MSSTVPAAAAATGGAAGNKEPVMPSQVTDNLSFFDKMANHTNRVVSRAPYFAACVLSVVIWAGFGPFARFSDTWQLIINTSTTILTFLMVALLQNSARRSDLAVQHKLNAIADALADLMKNEGPHMEQDRKELRRAVGLEKLESS